MADPIAGAVAGPPAAPATDDHLQRSAQDVLRLLLEVLDGRRPLQQLNPHLGPVALRYVRAAGRRHRGPSRLSSMHVCRPRPAAAEVAVVYRTGGRARALATRFEQQRGARGPWRCVAIRLG